MIYTTLCSPFAEEVITGLTGFNGLSVTFERGEFLGIRYTVTKGEVHPYSWAIFPPKYSQSHPVEELSLGEFVEKLKEVL